MQRIRELDFNFYTQWYLDRESREKGRFRLPPWAFLRKTWMTVYHGGKLVPWFGRQARWTLCRLESIEELSSLLVLSSPWTRDSGVVSHTEPRLLGNAARRAEETFFSNAALEKLPDLERRSRMISRLGLGWLFPRLSPLGDPRMYAYYERHQQHLTLDEDHCIVLRSLEGHERQELAQAGITETKYYLHDGFGRMLSYMVLLRRGRMEFRPVMAIVAERIPASEHFNASERSTAAAIQ